MTSEPVVVGIDAGGTRVRALVCDRDGRRCGSGTAAGANPVSRGVGDTATQLGVALSAALSGIDPDRVAMIALGMAGSQAFGAELAALLPGVGERLGLRCAWLQFSDLEVAFAAGSAADGGLVVLSGTGAAVAEIRDRRMARYVDGAGWLLGDRGSGFWLGWQAARAAVAARDGRGEPTVLAEWIGAEVGAPPAEPAALPGADRGTRDLVGALYRRSPVSLSQFAPLVSRAALAGDVVAVRLIEGAAQALLDEVALMLRPDTEWVVLAGGVLLGPGPLRDAVVAGLADRSVRIGEALDGAAGAAWRALQQLPGHQPAAAVHRRLTTGRVS
jgi:N-acetylglucosamine kinase-like BadF-type ATPase